MNANIAKNPLMKKIFDKFTNKLRQDVINKHNNNLIRVCDKKYNMLRIRNKISFMAFEKRMTIMEFLLRAISKNFVWLVRSGELPRDPKIFE